jgi:hypothetical protein
MKSLLLGYAREHLSKMLRGSGQDVVTRRGPREIVTAADAIPNS